MIALAGFALLGMKASGGEPQLGEIPVILETLESSFSLSPVLWPYLCFVFGMVAMRGASDTRSFVEACLGAFLRRRSKGTVYLKYLASRKAATRRRPVSRASMNC